MAPLARKKSVVTLVDGVKFNRSNSFGLGLQGRKQISVEKKPPTKRKAKKVAQENVQSQILNHLEKTQFSSSRNPFGSPQKCGTPLSSLLSPARSLNRTPLMSMLLSSPPRSAIRLEVAETPRHNETTPSKLAQFDPRMFTVEESPLSKGSPMMVNNLIKSPTRKARVRSTLFYRMEKQVSRTDRVVARNKSFTHFSDLLSNSAHEFQSQESSYLFSSLGGPGAADLEPSYSLPAFFLGVEDDSQAACAM